MDKVGNEYRVYLLRDLNGWTGNRVRASIMGTFRVPGENDNGRRVEFCAKKRGYMYVI